jgi:hypothetical protein
MSDDAVKLFSAGRIKGMTLDNLRVAVFTDIVNEYGIGIEDLPLFEHVVRSIRDEVHIERAHYGEDLEVVNTNQ